MPNAPIGELDEKITIESETVTDDGMGGQTSAWTTYASLWRMCGL